MEDIAKARVRGKGNPDKPDVNLENKEEISTKKSNVLVQLKNLLEEEEIAEDLDKVDKLNDLIKLVAAESSEKVKNFVGKIESINLTLSPVKDGVEPLKKIMKTGINKQFLKIVVGKKYHPFDLDISEIEDPLFEYTISELTISENKITILANLYVEDTKEFIVHSVGIFLVDQEALKKNKYKEILLALHTQVKTVELNRANQVNLILNI